MNRHLIISLMLLLGGPLAAQEVIDVQVLEIEPHGEDYAPVLLDSSFVMCSLRERNVDQLIEYTDAETEKRLSDLYRVRLLDGKPGKPFLLGEALTSEVNDGPATFSHKGDRICFSRNQTRAKKMGNVNSKNDRLGIYFAERTEGDWSDPVPFDYNSTEYSVTHPSFGGDGAILLFASDMPGGFGGMDLYWCDNEDGGWSLPLNLGPGINTEANEVFPFIQVNGILYFASDREGGHGGLDIHSATLANGQWGNVMLLPAPINSEANDISYTAWPTDRAGLFSSDRSGEDRIYRFKRTLKPFQDCAEQQQNNYCYVFQEEGSLETDTLPLKYQWDLGDGTRVTALTAEHCYKGPGSYLVKLNIVDTLTESIFFNEASYELLIDDIHQPYITAIDTARTGRPLVLDALHTHLPGWHLEDLQWDLGDGTFDEGRRVSHAYRDPGTYTVRLDVVGLPDSAGAIPHQCVTRTIAVIDRFKDVGDDAVLAVYQDASGVTREFEYRALPFDDFELAVKEGEDVSFTVQLFRSRERVSLDDPRFAEIRRFFPVYERFDPESGQYTYSVGEAKNLTEMYAIYAKVKELRFLDAEVMAIQPDKLVDMSSLAALDLEELNNTVVRASTVLFAYDKSTFDPSFGSALDKILEVLQEHEELCVAIEAHSDGKGRSDYNMKLSQKRAQAIVDDLKMKGVPEARMTAVGYGEDHPIASNDNEIGRSQNRRVEFRMVLRKEDQADARGR